MAQPILPFAYPIFLCDEYVARDRGKVDFLGAFQSIVPIAYPHVHRRMVVAAHLRGGFGEVHSHIEVRQAETGFIVAKTTPRLLVFQDRDMLIRLTNEVRGVRFPKPGIYLIELNCEDTCIADTSLELRAPIMNQPGGHE